MMDDLHSTRSAARLDKPPTALRVISGWRMWPLAMLLAGGILVFAFTTPVVADERAYHPRENTFMKREWGIEILFIRQTSAGYMLEFRYKVVDAKRALALFDRQTKPLLTHAESGAILIVPTPAKTGALRNSNPPIAGNTYWMFFANPGKLVEPGDRVSIEIGEFLADGIVVK